MLEFYALGRIGDAKLVQVMFLEEEDLGGGGVCREATQALITFSLGESFPKPAERHREYYMGEGGGFPRVRAVVSLVSPKSHVACPSTKGASESELTNLLVGWM